MTLLSIMVNMTGSFVSPSADATVSPQLFAPAGLLASVLDGFNVWKLLVTLFVTAVIYDQCKRDSSVSGSSLNAFQTLY